MPLDNVLMATWQDYHWPCSQCNTKAHWLKDDDRSPNLETLGNTREAQMAIRSPRLISGFRCGCTSRLKHDRGIAPEHGYTAPHVSHSQNSTV